MPDLDINALVKDSDGDDDLVKNLRKALREANTKRAEAERTLSERAKTDRTRALADVLKDKGVPEKAAKYFPADTEPTPEAVDKWLEEDGDLFGIVRQEVAPEVRDAAQRITGATATAPSGTTTMDVSALIAEMRNAKSPEELAAVYAKAGMVNPG